METLEKPKNLIEALKVHDIKKIEDFDLLKKYFDINILDEDSTPKIECEHKVVIISDNVDFNETYLIDIINEYLTDKQIVKDSVEFVYIDSIDVRHKLFAKNISNVGIIEKDFEKTYLSPCILTINPITNEICYFQEIMAPFELSVIQKIFQNTKIEE